MCNSFIWNWSNTMNVYSALWILMAWCFSTRASVATVLTTHPCVCRCLRVKLKLGPATIPASLPPLVCWVAAQQGTPRWPRCCSAPRLAAPAAALAAGCAADGSARRWPLDGCCRAVPLGRMGRHPRAAGCHQTCCCSGRGCWLYCPRSWWGKDSGMDLTHWTLGCFKGILAKRFSS